MLQYSKSSFKSKHPSAQQKLHVKKEKKIEGVHPCVQQKKKRHVKMLMPGWGEITPRLGNQGELFQNSDYFDFARCFVGHLIA